MARPRGPSTAIPDSFFGVSTTCGVLSGIKLEKESKTLHIMAGNATMEDGLYKVAVELCDGHPVDGATRLHARARAILGEEVTSPPSSAFLDIDAIAAEPYRRSVDDIYRHILFHGNELKGIRRVIGASARGMAAELITAPSPERWIDTPLRSRWIADPLVLDAAFQMAIVWCFEEKGLMSLPHLRGGVSPVCAPLSRGHGHGPSGSHPFQRQPNARRHYLHR